MAVTANDLKQIARGVAPVVREFVERELEPLRHRLAELESAAALAKTAAPAVEWAGTWQPGRMYRKGQAVTQSGGLWLSREATSDQPGRARAWVLIVKRGTYDD